MTFINDFNRKVEMLSHFHKIIEKTSVDEF